ncbi:hypothetical protein J6590_055491 [Homalodisca vitripennis]|nr:hypothetical protein J6590_055491 [Homalodisca vitripennis]
MKSLEEKQGKGRKEGALRSATAQGKESLSSGPGQKHPTTNIPIETKTTYVTSTEREVRTVEMVSCTRLASCPISCDSPTA